MTSSLLRSVRQKTINLKYQKSKRQLAAVSDVPSRPEAVWRDIPGTADVELASEDDAGSIEGALALGRGQGWRASGYGVPIQSALSSTSLNRSGALTWSSTRPKLSLPRNSFCVGHRALKKGFREIVRQQWNFISPGGVREIEDYAVNLFDVGVLELIIMLDKGGGEALASLVKMRVA